MAAVLTAKASCTLSLSLIHSSLRSCTDTDINAPTQTKKDSVCERERQAHNTSTVPTAVSLTAEASSTEVSRSCTEVSPFCRSPYASSVDMPAFLFAMEYHVFIYHTYIYFLFFLSKFCALCSNVSFSSPCNGISRFYILQWNITYLYIQLQVMYI